MLSPAYVQSETLGILPATAKPFEILYDLFFHHVGLSAWAGFAGIATKGNKNAHADGLFL
jgi:hypothetical protein